MEKQTKLVLELYKKNKKKAFKDFYNKFVSNHLVIKAFSDEEISNFQNIRELFYAIAKSNREVKFSKWSKFIKISDEDLVKLSVEYPLFINRIDSKNKLVSIFNKMSDDEIKRISLASGVKMDIRLFAKSFYNIFYLFKEQENSLKTKNVKTEKSNKEINQ